MKGISEGLMDGIGATECAACCFTRGAIEAGWVIRKQANTGVVHCG